MFRLQFGKTKPAFRERFVEPMQMHVFTDGSCFHNQYRHFAIGGSAAIFFTEKNQTLPTFQIRTILPAVEHSSYRAEIYSTFVAIKLCEKPTIYTHCQAVVDTWEQTLQALHSNQTASVDDHIDFWGPIIACLATFYHYVKIVKVKAHTDGHDWISIANAQADCEAKKSITEDHHNLLEFASQRVNVLLRLRRVQHRVMCFQTQAAIMEFNHCHNLTTQREASISPRMALTPSFN